MPRNRTHPLPHSPMIPLFLLFLAVSFHSSFASSTAKNFINRGYSLSVEDHASVLASLDQSFTCGFYLVGSNAYSFSIWFTNSRERTVAWMANRDLPVNGRGSRVSLLRDGTMVLTDVDGSTVWSTNTTGTKVDKAELLNTGNLVLKDPSGKILWQSFDSPIDTLLPSQPLTKSKKLVSATSKRTYYSGYFSLFFDSDNVLKLMYDGPEISSLYWPNPDYSVFQNGRTSYNSSRIAVLDEMGRFLSSDRMEFMASDMGFGTRRRLTLDYDGNLRLYSLNELTGLWVISWQALAQLCNVHGLCGKNGICLYTPQPKCSCPPGHEMSDPSDWSKGCRPTFNLSCEDTEKLRFVEIPHTDFYGFDFYYGPSTSFESCMKLCLGNCTCKAFVYRLTGEATCYTKSALFNGYRSPRFVGNLYLKLPTSVETSETLVLGGTDITCGIREAETNMGLLKTLDAGSGKTKWVYLYLFLCVIGAIEIVFIISGWWCLFRGQKVSKLIQNGYHIIPNQFRKFTYAELMKATKIFKEELGRGGSGAVYKGLLGDNTVVAVKKLEDVIEGEDAFWAEVSTFARVNHVNIVGMLGFCSEGTKRLLVYEYVENGSLSKNLFSDASSNSNGEASSLSWKERFRIALGTAKGLAYLHHECLEWVIHCDVKPENILLNRNFDPKISDFGLAKLSQRCGSGLQVSRIRGTMGYLAPEWASNLPITTKVDVYSFGVVLLEIVKGIRLSSWMVANGEEAEQTRFLWLVKKKIECGDDSWVEDIVDPALKGQFNKKQAARMVEIGISCIEEDKSKRPAMDEVVQFLLECEDGPKLPTLDMP
ncbi:PREDICTED: putative receptor protein kinase ZmPK1 [Nelumbo nucifera]|uniref:Receptor-like serine/threonine-protein kinase n=2 Tax=Nelumbo nucifera TaxID=4432 RepID=A0A822Y5E2_NELNU|nr:PREDICTED: putative receptor protein kinase ZmPK1 [Nelumbo nucifera]DAD26549.1 TPA_asm: hypothetical protein HUJ06_028017 [Nelumbo nucifera]